MKELSVSVNVVISKYAMKNHHFSSQTMFSSIFQCLIVVFQPFSMQTLFSSNFQCLGFPVLFNADFVFNEL